MYVVVVVTCNESVFFPPRPENIRGDVENRHIGVSAAAALIQFHPRNERANEAFDIELLLHLFPTHWSE